MTEPDEPTAPTTATAEAADAADAANAANAADTASETEPPARPSRMRVVWDWARPLIVLLVALSSFRSAVADWNDVPTGSMKPTILEGDRVFVNKIAYDLKVPFTTWRLAEWDNPHRGDIVVLLSPEDARRLIKRVIGLPGDILTLRGDRLFVNGEPAQYAAIDPSIAARLRPNQPLRRYLAWEELDGEKHPVMVTPALHSPLENFGPIAVPKDEYFMMGDNRDESRDSRVIGFVPRKLILGQALGVAFSVDHHKPGLHFRPHRFFEALEY